MILEKKNSPLLRTHLSQQITPRDFGNVHNIGNSCKDILSCATWHWNYPGFCTCWWKSLLVSSVSLLSGGTVQPETPSIFKVTYQVCENENKISIKISINIATTSGHLSKSVSTDVTTQIQFKPFKRQLHKMVKHLECFWPCMVREAGRCNKIYPIRYFYFLIPSLEGWPTKA